MEPPLKRLGEYMLICKASKMLVGLRTIIDLINVSHLLKLFIDHIKRKIAIVLSQLSTDPDIDACIEYVASIRSVDKVKRMIMVIEEVQNLCQHPHRPADMCTYIQMSVDSHITRLSLLPIRHAAS